MCVGFDCFKLGMLACVRRVWLFQTWYASICAKGLAVSNLGC